VADAARSYARNARQGGDWACGGGNRVAGKTDPKVEAVGWGVETDALGQVVPRSDGDEAGEIGSAPKADGSVDAYLHPPNTKRTRKIGECK
jgi:hypothetical protein